MGRRWKKCAHCRTEFLGGREKTLCSEVCRKARAYLKGNQKRKEPSMTPGQVDAMLDRAIEMESTPRYLRAPIPWD